MTGSLEEIETVGERIVKELIKKDAWPWTRAMRVLPSQIKTKKVVGA